MYNDLSTIEDPVITKLPDGKQCLYYGNFGSGKTYAASSDIIRLCETGHTVYATWRIVIDDFDQRSSFRHIFFGLLGKKKYFYFSHKNFHYVPLHEVDSVYPQTTDCYWFIDEGHLWLNSYVGTKLDLPKMASILHTRHFSRTLCIVTQRPTAVHVTLRANINVFYKCKKVISWPWPVFVRQEFQDMKEDTVDEEAKPISTRWYFGNPKVFAAYDSKYMRGDTPRSQPIYGETFILPYYKRIFLFLNKLLFNLPKRLLRGVYARRGQSKTISSSSSPKWRKRLIRLFKRGSRLDK